ILSHIKAHLTEVSDTLHEPPRLSNKTSIFTSEDLFILSELAQGRSIKDISQKLYKSSATITARLKKIRTKYQVSSNIELVSKALINGHLPKNVYNRLTDSF
ncbi:LuxR C-terminal-related transcriptional regulator, partial [Piscibacillus sp. B03]|uniref:LuxR C-terminal-related transcriptional regulator n=1 Tax=Piscibacillus sp. B03 TaxID=3457430 RepID=UPI003FCC525C